MTPRNNLCRKLGADAGRSAQNFTDMQNAAAAEAYWRGAKRVAGFAIAVFVAVVVISLAMEARAKTARTCKIFAQIEELRQ